RNSLTDPHLRARASAGRDLDLQAAAIQLDHPGGAVIGFVQAYLDFMLKRLGLRLWRWPGPLAGICPTRGTHPRGSAEYACKELRNTSPTQAVVQIPIFDAHIAAAGPGALLLLLLLDKPIFPIEASRRASPLLVAIIGVAQLVV